MTYSKTVNFLNCNKRVLTLRDAEEGDVVRIDGETLEVWEMNETTALVCSLVGEEEGEEMDLPLTTVIDSIN